MTGKEARPLIEAVQEAGGPIGIVREDRLYVTTLIDGRHVPRAALVRVDMPRIQDELAGALKRDLYQRGCGIDLNCHPHVGTWRVMILRHKEHGGGWTIANTEAETEFEALLTAWVDASQHEGWGS